MQNLCGLTKEEIINMMSKISAICVANDCWSCPFGDPFGDDTGYCKIKNIRPCDWSISYDIEIWRALE